MTWLSANPYYEMFASRALFLAGYGGADFGECAAIVGRIGDGDVDTWHREWCATADRLVESADDAAVAGHRASARAYVRATTYYRGGPRPPRACGLELRRLPGPRGAAFERERLAALWADPAAWDRRAMVASLPLADDEKARFPEGVVRPSSSRWRTTCAPTRPTRCSAGGSSSGGCGSTARTPCSTTSPR